MNVKDFSYLLKHPHEALAPEHSKQLEGIIAEYPYFQAARALHLKSLKDNHSFKYNNALKVTAAHTTDRDVLFDFITSDEFLRDPIAETLLDKSITKAAPLPTEEGTANKDPVDLIEESEDKPLPRTLKDADQLLDPALFESKNRAEKETTPDTKDQGSELQLGAPIRFTKKEKHSFGEWLQLASLKPLETGEPDKGKSIGGAPGPDPGRQKKEKFQRIDKFLEESPKIVPVENSPEINIGESLTFDKNELMTETLARVYLEQKKYKKALQAYKILSLKYPEKSGFFADRIKAVEKLKKENS